MDFPETHREFLEEVYHGKRDTGKTHFVCGLSSIDREPGTALLKCSALKRGQKLSSVEFLCFYNASLVTLGRKFDVLKVLGGSLGTLSLGKALLRVGVN